MNLNQTLFLLFCIILGLNAEAQNFEGVDFRFSFINNLDSAYNGPPKYIISGEAVEADTEINLTFGSVGDPDYINEQFTVLAGETYSLVYENDFLYPREYEEVLSKSFHIQSTEPITVYATYYRLYYSEGSAIIPTSELSDEYKVVSINYTGSSLDVPQPSLATIVAIEDNTEVHFIPSAPLISGAAAGLEQTIILNAGDTYTLASMGDLTNTYVFSSNDVPIAVFSGHKHTYVGCGADNYLFEQLIPLDLWSDHYALIPTGNEGHDLLRIIAAEDNTEVYVGCTYLTTINTGEFYETTLETTNIYNSTGPILPVIFSKGIACNEFDTGDPSMRIPIPLYRGNTSLKVRMGYNFEGLIGLVEEYYFVHLVTTAADSSSVLIDGVPVTNWTQFDGLSELVFATPEVSPSPSIVEITSSAPFWAEYIALGDFDAVAMSLGSDTTLSFPPLQPFFFSLGPDFGLCPDDSAILETDIGIEGTWQDGSHSESFLVQEPGLYTIYVPNPCGTSRDTVVVFANEVSDIHLENSYHLCEGDSALLNPSIENAQSIEWSTGSLSNQIYVSEPDWYYVSAISVDGCFAFDSTLVELETVPDIKIISSAEYICPGDQVTMELLTDANEVMWSSGENTMSIVVTDGGDYSVTAISDFGCESMDEFYLEEKQLPYIIAFDSLFCEGAEFYFVPISNSEVTWPGYSESDTLFVVESGTYVVQANNECGELTQNIIFESEDCSCSLHVPNIFSPNGDGKNDLFLVWYECEENLFFQLSIKDRWGLEVFNTSNPALGWNGGVENNLSKEVSEGVYYAIIVYDSQDKSGTIERKTETTMLTVVR